MLELGMRNENVRHDRKPKSILLTTISVFLVACLMAAWAVSTLAHAHDFGAAAYRFSASHPDVDLAPGWFELAYVGSAVVSLLFSVVLTFLGIWVLRRGRASLIWSMIVCAVAIPFAYVTYEDHGQPYMFPGDLSIAAAPMQILTPWRFAGWYYEMTIWSGLAVIFGLAVAIIMAAMPESRRFVKTSALK